MKTVWVPQDLLVIFHSMHTGGSKGHNMTSAFTCSLYPFPVQLLLGPWVKSQSNILTPTLIIQPKMSASFYMDRISELSLRAHLLYPPYFINEEPSDLPKFTPPRTAWSSLPGCHCQSWVCSSPSLANKWRLAGSWLTSGITVNPATAAASAVDIFSALNLSRPLNSHGLTNSFTCCLYMQHMPVPWDSLRLTKKMGWGWG